MGNPIFKQTHIKRSSQDKQVHSIVVEYEGEEIPTQTHEEVPTLTNKYVLSVMGDHLQGSFIHDGIYVPQFHYDRFHTVGTDFDEDIFMTIVKSWDGEQNDELHYIFQNGGGDLKIQVKESKIAWIKTLSLSTKMLAVHPCYIPFTQPLFSQSH